MFALESIVASKTVTQGSRLKRLEVSYFISMSDKISHTAACSIKGSVTGIDRGGNMEQSVYCHVVIYEFFHV